MQDDRTAPLSWYRVHEKPAPGGKTEVWFEDRTWVYYLIGWLTPVKWGVGVREHSLADHDRRLAMSKFIELIKEAEDMLAIVERHKDDVQEARKFVNANRQKEGISSWYQWPRRPRQDGMPDLSKEFEEAKKRFLKGRNANKKSRLGTPEDATRSEYWPKGVQLPQMRGEGKEFDHTIEYDPNRNKRNQNQQQKSRGKGKGGDPRHRGIKISVDEDD